MLSRCFLDFSVGVGAFVIGLCQTPSLFCCQVRCYKKTLTEGKSRPEVSNYMNPENT